MKLKDSFFYLFVIMPQVWMLVEYIRWILKTTSYYPSLELYVLRAELFVCVIPALAYSLYWIISREIRLYHFKYSEYQQWRDSALKQARREAEKEVEDLITNIKRKR